MNLRNASILVTFLMAMAIVPLVAGAATHKATSPKSAASATSLQTGASEVSRSELSRAELSETPAWMKREGPTLGGHRFLLSSAVGSPFITDQVAMTFGVGAVSVNRADTPDNPYRFAGFSPAIEIHKNIFDWVEFNVQANGIVLSASNESTVVDLAESAFLNVQPGLTIRLLKADSHMLSISGQVGFEQRYILSPKNYINTALNSGNLALTSLLVKQSVTTWMPGIRYGVGFFDMMGMMFEARGGFASRSQTGQDPVSESTLRLGSALSFDLKPGIGIPLGLSAGYGHDFALNDGASALNEVTAGLFETASRNFNFGLEFHGSFQTDSSQYAGLISMRYYY